MSPVCFVSVKDFLVSPALNTAHDSVGFFLKFCCFFSKYFQILGLLGVFEGTFSSIIPPCIHSWERSLSILLPIPIFHALVVVLFSSSFFFLVVAYI